MKKATLPSLLTLIVVALGACGEPGGSIAGSPDDPVTSSSDPTASSPADGGAQRVVPRDGLVDIAPRPFEESKVLDDGTAVDVFFHSGIEECYGLDRVDVEYRRESIVITLFEGRVPEAEVCIEIAVQKVTRVLLEEPVRHRQIVDGAK